MKKTNLLILLFFVPVILVVFYLFPSKIKENYFILTPSNPTITSIFLSNFTHSSPQHLIMNLLSYLILIPSILHLETNRKRFYLFFLLALTLVPILSSLLVIYLIPQLPPVQGFSAVTSALTGYLLYSVYSYAKKNFQANYFFFFFLIMVNFALWSAYNSRIILFLISALTALLLFYVNRTEIKEILSMLISKFRELRELKFMSRVYNIVIFAFIVSYAFSLYALIPPEIVVENMLINTPAHYFGYCFGVFVPFVLSFFFSQKNNKTFLKFFR